MLVRNNTACPHCGKLSATDWFVSETFSGLAHDYWKVTIECYDCLAIEDYSVHVSVLRGWMRLLAESGDPVEKWSPNWSPVLSVNQRESLRRSFERICPRGGVDHRSASFPQLWKIISYLRRVHGPVEGETFRAFSRAWSCL